MGEALVYTRRVQRRDDTTISNAALLDKRLTLAQRGLFALMLTTVGETAKPARFYLKSGGISAETFYKYVGRLEELGYLARVQKHSKNGQFSATIYSLDDAPCTEKPCTEKPCTEKPYTGKPHTAIDSYNNNTYLGIENNNNPPITPQPTVCAWQPQRFEGFWTFYRTVFCTANHNRAGNKAAAATAWDKLKPSDETISKMGVYLKAHMKTQDWTKFIGVPAASTFLNRLRRKEISLDELPEADASAAEDSKPAGHEQPKEAFFVWT